MELFKLNLMKGISIKRFECYLLYLLSIHMAALFISGSHCSVPLTINFRQK